jgi:ankyrin repeat protein
VAMRLLDAGADVNARASNGWTPLMYADWTKQTGAVEALRSRGGERR